MLPVIIEKGSTRASMIIDFSASYAPLLRDITHKYLTDYEYQPRTKKYIPTKKYLRYDNVSKKLYIPITMIDQIIEALEFHGIEYQVTEEKLIEPRNLTIKMNNKFVPREHQKGIIEYLKQDKPYRKGLAVQTGSGKTVSAIAGMIAYGKVGMIVVSRLHHQWLDELKKFTNIKDDQVVVLQGFESLMRLCDSEKKPEVLIFSLETLRAFCTGQGKYADLPSYDQFIEYYGIGYKIMDEVHLNFHADTQIDLASNIKNNVYLTATFTSGNPSTRRIFEQIYPKEMRYGEGVLERYTDAYCYFYCGNVPEKKCVTARGYNHIKYEQFLLKKPIYLNEYFDRFVSPLIHSHYINRKQPGQKLAIFFATLEMIDKAYVRYKEEFKDLKVNKYISGTDDNVLKESDIILTTAKSMGVGTNVKNLITVINTVSTKSPTAVLQICGRLRKIEGVKTQYVDMCDRTIHAQMFHQKDRKYILEPSVNNYILANLY